MIIFGVALLLVGLFVAAVHVLLYIGNALIVVGLLLALLGATGRPVAGPVRARLPPVAAAGPVGPPVRQARPGRKARSV